MDNALGLVLDIGTSSLKVALTGPSGRVLGAISSDWRHLLTQGEDEGELGFCPDSLWRLITGMLEEILMPACKDDSVDGTVQFIGITSQRQGIVLFDGQGRDFTGIPNIDGRARAVARDIGERFGEEIYMSSGRWPNAVHPVSKLCWLKENDAKVFARIESFLSLAEWAAWKMTGEMVACPSLACESGLFDIRKGDWDTGLMVSLGMDKLRMPSVAADDKVGSVKEGALPEICRKALPEGLPVIIAGADTQCGCLGCGAVSSGEVAIIAGSSAPVQMVGKEPVFDEKRRTITNNFLWKGTWVLESNAMMTGFSAEWGVKLLDEAAMLLGLSSEVRNKDIFRAVDTALDGSQPGASGACSIVGIGIMDSMKGSILPEASISMPWSSVVARKLGMKELLRASLESVGYAIKANLQQISEITKVPASGLEIFLGGGATRSGKLVSLIVDILNHPVRLSEEHDVTIRGAALEGERRLRKLEPGQIGQLIDGNRGYRMVEPEASHRNAGYAAGFERWKSSFMKSKESLRRQ